MSNHHAQVFLSVTQLSGNYFRGTPARSALTWVIVSQNSSSTFSRTAPPPPPSAPPPVPGAPAWPRVGLRRSTTPGGCRSRQTARPRGCVVADLGACWRHTRPPLRPPVRAVVVSWRGTGLPFLDVNGLVRRNTVVVPGKLVGRVAVEVDPFDVVSVAAAHRDHVHRRHRRLPYPLVAGPQVSHPARDRCRTNRWSPRATGVAQPWSPSCEWNHREMASVKLISFPSDSIIAHRKTTSARGADISHRAHHLGASSMNGSETDGPVHGEAGELRPHTRKRGLAAAPTRCARPG